MTLGARRIFRITLIVAACNFALFYGIALAIGGDAFNGKAEGGHYYLGGHGHLTEVSSVTYWYSFTHAISVFCTHGAALVIGLASAGFGPRGEGNQ